jgi:hypothetical protein
MHTAKKLRPTSLPSPSLPPSPTSSVSVCLYCCLCACLSVSRGPPQFPALPYPSSGGTQQQQHGAHWHVQGSRARVVDQHLLDVERKPVGGPFLLTRRSRLRHSTTPPGFEGEWNFLAFPQTFRIRRKGQTGPVQTARKTDGSGHNSKKDRWVRSKLRE